MSNPKVTISNRFKATRPKHLYGRNPRFWVSGYEVAKPSKAGLCVAALGVMAASFGFMALVCGVVAHL